MIAQDLCGANGNSMDFNLLRFFAEHAGETLDRGRLMEQTRGRDLGPLDRSLDVQVSRLRQRLSDDGKHPVLIKTVRGSGYVFSADVTTTATATVSDCTDQWRWFSLV